MLLCSSQSRTEKEARKLELKFDEEVKSKFKEHDGLIKEAVKGKIFNCSKKLICIYQKSKNLRKMSHPFGHRKVYIARLPVAVAHNQTQP